VFVNPRCMGRKSIPDRLGVLVSRLLAPHLRPHPLVRPSSTIPMSAFWLSLRTAALCQSLHLGAGGGIDKLGPEPLTRDMTAAGLETAFARRRAPIKSVLLDQRVVAGIGNIYASEILYRAGIDPRRSARGLLRSEVEAVHTAIRDVLREAIRQGGTTFRDYRNARGGRGGFRPRVYKRAGEPCDLCGTGLEKTVIAGRSTFYCSRCQK
jgi:formamidopyrimidine-DNA glycosylase